jgi:hypothetical protein
MSIDVPLLLALAFAVWWFAYVSMKKRSVSRQRFVASLLLGVLLAWSVNTISKIALTDLFGSYHIRF